MWEIIWPILLAAAANTFYNICAKEAPAGINVYGFLVVTYLVAGLFSAIMYFFTAGNSTIMNELSKLNWSAFALGLSIFGVEVAYMFIYRAGWQIKNGAIAANSCLAIMLLLVGVFIYKESLSLVQLIGMAFCLGGLVLMLK